MPPKSAKKEKPLWYTCEKCDCTITSSEISKHENNCSNKYQLSGYIEHKTLHTKRIEISKHSNFDELKTIQEFHLNNIVLISEAVLKICEFVIGEFVKVEFKCLGQTSVVVKKVWPIDDKYLTSIFINRLDEFQVGENLTATIAKIDAVISPCKNVILQLQNSDDEEEVVKNEKELMNILKKHSTGHIILQKNPILLNVCNKRFRFKVKSLNSEDGSIEEKMKNLCLQSQYFSLDHNTNFSVFKQEKADVTTKEKYFDLRYIGGLNKQINEIKTIMDIALGQTNTDINVPISHGLLLYGVSGVGKTLLTNSLAQHFKCDVLRINSSEVFSKFYGESEANVAKCFNRAILNYPKPTIIIVEEVHNICPKNDSTDIVKRISMCFTNLLDNLHTNAKAKRIFVIATTNNPDELSTSIRRSGRLDYEIEIPVPNAEAREDIITKLLSKTSNSVSPSEVAGVAKVTHGYVGADLECMVSRAMTLDDNILSCPNLMNALKHVKASAMREILIECPNVKWTDIGGQDALKLKLKQIIEWPINHPEIFIRLGISAPRGLLMFGPPGCSKTMIAKAIASESKVNFLSIKGSELFSMWVGESERAVKELFRKARQVSPSIIFFDEIDAIGGERSAESGSSVKERVLAQILTEIDGVNVLKNVKIIAATNRPDLIDKALMRPGRLDRIIYVGLPDEKTRQEIFKIKLKRIPIAEDVQLDYLIEKTEGYSGSEIEAVCQEAVLKALETSFDILEISKKYFDLALEVIRPRTSKDLLQIYENYLKIQ